MSGGLVLILAILGVAAVFGWIFLRGNLVARILAALAFLALALFCAFGFLASYELDGPARLPWQIGYGIGGVACLAGAVLMLVPKRKRRSESTPPVVDR